MSGLAEVSDQVVTWRYSFRRGPSQTLGDVFDFAFTHMFKYVASEEAKVLKWHRCLL